MGEALAPAAARGLLRSPNRLLGLLLGVALAALGVAGFLVGSTGFADPAGGLLFGVLSTNSAQGLLHLACAAALVVAAVVGLRPSRTVNGGLGAVFLALGLFGLFAVGTPANLLALNGPGNVLHFAVSTVLLAVGLGAERRNG